MHLVRTTQFPAVLSGYGMFCPVRGVLCVVSFALYRRQLVIYLPVFGARI